MVRWNKAYIKNTREVVGIDDEFPPKTEFECMSCGAKMIRKRGQYRVHHFAHKETTECNPESFFHKLGKKIFKDIYDNSPEYIITLPSKSIDLKLEYGECLMEEAGIILDRRSDLYIKHIKDKDKDISVEILFTHQVSKEKIDKGYRIIEIRLPNKYSSEDITNDDIEQEIKEICTPPLFNNEYIRLYNFEEGVTYIEPANPISNLSFNHSSLNELDGDCIGMDLIIKSTPKFRNYISYVENSKKEIEAINDSDENEDEDPIATLNQTNKITEQTISRDFIPLKNEYISPTIYFEVSDAVKKKYPYIKHRPAVLPNYKQIIDIILNDNDDITFGIDYRKHEVIVGDFDRKIPQEFKDAVREYILDLRPIK